VKESARYLAPLLTRVTDIVVDHAEGCYLFTDDHRKILDFTSGYGVTNTGHCHPKVVAAIQRQASRLLHAQQNLMYHTTLLQLLEKLHEVLPPHLDRVFFHNSGADAVECAVKVARHATGKTNLIVFQNAFHGRTALTCSLTSSKVRHRSGWQPLMAGVFVAPYPYSYFYGWEPEATSTWCLKQLRHMLHTQTAPEETAAIMIEPILGDGGFVNAPLSFLHGLRQLCIEYNILLIFDEIQSGWGRTGKLFGYQYAEGVEPDILIMAKGLASGLPISAIAAPAALMEKCPVGIDGGTLSGNPVPSAAAMATIEVIFEEGLMNNATKRGRQMTDLLYKVQQETGFAGEIRGPGLMVGLELSQLDGSPATPMARAVQLACLQRQMLIATSGPYSNSFRWAPPLTITSAQIEDGVSIFREALLEVLRS
jgi:4-aminobutyrate aminotransferase